MSSGDVGSLERDRTITETGGVETCRAVCSTGHGTGGEGGYATADRSSAYHPGGSRRVPANSPSKSSQEEVEGWCTTNNNKHIVIDLIHSISIY